jgi:adenylylsulfate kinase-like enzyme
MSSIWIMGLSSAGKSTLANMLVERLRNNGYPCMLLDGDQIREIFPERLGYDAASRRKQTERVLRLVKWVSNQGILPVVAIIHPFEDDRLRCRSELPGYFETYLKCDLDTCIERDEKIKKHVYPWNNRERDEKDNIVGLDINYDEPAHSDLTLNSARMSPSEMLDALWECAKQDLLPDYKLRVVNG